GLRDGVPGDGEHVAVAGGEVIAVGLLLVRLVGIEAPPAAVGLQELGRVLPLRPLGPVGIAVGVGWRSDLDEEPARLVEREALGLVLRRSEERRVGKAGV